jgi:hypothetical protein
MALIAFTMPISVQDGRRRVVFGQQRGTARRELSQVAVASRA